VVALYTLLRLRESMLLPASAQLLALMGGYVGRGHPIFGRVSCEEDIETQNLRHVLYYFMLQTTQFFQGGIPHQRGIATSKLV
jgi:hypothetical protein